MSDLFFASAPLEVVRSDAKEVEVSFSSDTPIEHVGIGKLRLEHSHEAVDLKRLNSGVGAVLLEHNRYEQIGSVVRAWVDTAARKCKAIIRFGANDRAGQIWADVASGTRRGISVGFRIHERKQHAPDLWAATRWEPIELSIVSIPADPNVGVGIRSFNNDSKLYMKKTEYSAAEVGELMDLERDFGLDSREVMNRGLTIADAKTEALKLASEAAQRNRQSAAAARGAGSSVPIMKNGEIVHNGGGGGSRSDYGDYNLLRAIRSASTGEDCHERDVSRDLARRSGRDPSGILVPMEVLSLTSPCF